MLYAVPSLLDIYTIDTIDIYTIDTIDIYTIDAHLIHFQFRNLIAFLSFLEQCYILM